MVGYKHSIRHGMRWEGVVGQLSARLVGCTLNRPNEIRDGR